MFFSLWYTVGESGTRGAPPCGCLPLSLFDLIDVPLSLLLHFIPLSLPLLCLPIGAVLYHLYMYMVAFLALRILYVVALVCFVFVPWCFPSWIPPWRWCPLQATSTPASFCLLSFLFFSFPTVFVPNLFWCNFLYLVTTAGFVADQLIMWEFCFNLSSSCDMGEPGMGSAPLSFYPSRCSLCLYTSFFYFPWLLSPSLHLCFYSAVCCIRCPCLHAWVVSHRL